jgi:hypothetical protein
MAPRQLVMRWWAWLLFAGVCLAIPALGFLCRR